MKNIILPILLFVFCLNTENSFASCNSTINDLSLGSYSSYNLNTHFSGTPGPNFMHYELDLYVNDIHQSTSIETNPNATNSILTSNMDMLTACLIEIKARAVCYNGESGPELDIILTIDEVWDCIDYGNLCNGAVLKLYNDDNDEGLLTEYLVPCLCSIAGFQQASPEDKKIQTKNIKEDIKLSPQGTNAVIGEKTEYDPCTKFTKKLFMENGVGEAKRSVEDEVKTYSFGTIYPNPSFGKVVINKNLIENLIVYNLIGELVPFSISNNEVIINDDTKGLLIFKSTYEGKSIIEKILVK